MEGHFISPYKAFLEKGWSSISYIELNYKKSFQWRIFLPLKSIWYETYTEFCLIVSNLKKKYVTVIFLIFLYLKLTFLKNFSLGTQLSWNLNILFISQTTNWSSSSLVMIKQCRQTEITTLDIYIDGFLMPSKPESILTTPTIPFHVLVTGSGRPQELLQNIRVVVNLYLS